MTEFAVVLAYSVKFSLVIHLEMLRSLT